MTRKQFFVFEVKGCLQDLVRIKAQIFAKTKQEFPHAQDDKDYAKALKDLKMFSQELDNTFNEGSDEENMI
jgi:hypothetical protein